MATTVLSTTLSHGKVFLGQLCSGKNGMASSPRGLRVGKVRKGRATCMSNGVPADIGKRQLMNLLLLGAVSLPAAGLLEPYAAFGVENGTIAKDDDGKEIIASNWLKDHAPNDRTLAVGIKDAPTYIVVEQDRTLAKYGINAICTHMGCVVPWNEAEDMFMCPCHGSQYDNQGMVVQGPAPKSLALVHADVLDGKVVFTPWIETDFRTEEAPWWDADYTVEPI